MNTRPLVCALFLVAPLAAEALPAFPGASGAGATSVGGRGGVIYEVTNLNNNGPGSFRMGVEMSGPRIIVFRVGGTIELTGGLAIKNPYITIAGQTAPGGGITLSGKTSKYDVLSIRTHDVIMRYVRIRKGYSADHTDNNGDAINTIDSAENAIIDHCSMSWSEAKNGKAWGSNGTPVPRNITYSWNIFSEGLLNRSGRNFLTGANSSESAGAMTDIDVHHSLFTNSYERNPLVKNKTFRFINNIVYNWSRSATRLGGGVNIDLIGNLYKAGPLNGTYSPASVHEIQVFLPPNSTTPLGSPSLYVVGNIGPHNVNPNNDNWIMAKQIASEGGTVEGIQLPTEYKRTSPLPALPVPITVYPVNELENLVLPQVGASRRLDCLGNWVSNRDTVDTRIIQEYHTNKGIIPTTENDVGGFPTIANGTPCADADHDGMPDAWEDANGLNKNNPADGPLVGPDGYTNVERYLNGSTAQTLISAPKNVRFVQP